MYNKSNNNKNEHTFSSLNHGTDELPLLKTDLVVVLVGAVVAGESNVDS